MSEEKKQHGGRRPGAGRKKGVPNRITADIKAMVLCALDRAGGEKYMLEQARSNPNAFLTLVGKVLPTQITGANDGPVDIRARYKDLPDHILVMIGKK